MTNIDISNEKKKVIGECIGLVAMEWAHLELLVDGCIAIFHDFFYGNSREQHKPRSFKRKTKYIRASIKRLDTMSWATMYLHVLDELDSSAEKRNWFIHGALIEANDNQELKFVSHDFDAKPVGLQYRTVKYDEIYALFVETNRLRNIMKELFNVVDDFLCKHIPSFRDQIFQCDESPKLGSDCSTQNAPS
jgi:hypothetical protein